MITKRIESAISPPLQTTTSVLYCIYEGRCVCVSSASRGKRGAAEKEKRTYWFRPGDFPRAGGSLSPRAAFAAAVAIRVGNGVVPYGLPPSFPPSPRRQFQFVFSGLNLQTLAHSAFRSLPPLYPVMKEQPFSAANLLCSQSARPTRYEVPSTHQSGGSGCVETKQIIG